MQARQSKHCIGGSTRRERERDVCVCVLLNFQIVFLLCELVYVFQSFVAIFAKKKKKKKSDRTRCLAVSILGYNLGPKIIGSEGHY